MKHNRVEDIAIAQFYKKEKIPFNPPANTAKLFFGTWFPYNNYLDVMGQYVTEGFVFFLDDDDKISSPDAVQKIVSAVRTDEDL